ncbi:MAG: hypothetical protein JWR48_2815 [Mycobacterium sp.]|nr:hypothetical protein [Mycobacterium sp.]
MATNLLADRLRDLEATGVIERRLADDGSAIALTARAGWGATGRGAGVAPAALALVELRSQVVWFPRDAPLSGWRPSMSVTRAPAISTVFVFQRWATPGQAAQRHAGARAGEQCHDEFDAIG